MDVGTRQLFIYYRVNAARAAEAMAAVGSMQRMLQARYIGLRAVLLRRPTDEPDVTLMETYAFDARIAPQGVSPSLQAEIETQAQVSLGTLLAGSRHVEVFEACA